VSAEGDRSKGWKGVRCMCGWAHFVGPVGRTCGRAHFVKLVDRVCVGGHSVSCQLTKSACLQCTCVRLALVLLSYLCMPGACFTP